MEPKRTPKVRGGCVGILASLGVFCCVILGLILLILAVIAVKVAPILKAVAGSAQCIGDQLKGVEEFVNSSHLGEEDQEACDALDKSPCQEALQNATDVAEAPHECKVDMTRCTCAGLHIIATLPNLTESLATCCGPVAKYSAALQKPCEELVHNVSAGMHEMDEKCSKADFDKLADDPSFGFGGSSLPGLGTSALSAQLLLASFSPSLRELVAPGPVLGLGTALLVGAAAVATARVRAGRGQLASGEYRNLPGDSVVSGTRV